MDYNTHLAKISSAGQGLCNMTNKGLANDSQMVPDVPQIVPYDCQMVMDGSQMVPDDSRMIPDDYQLVTDDSQIAPGDFQMTSRNRMH